jgi:hypothetical protein
MTRHGQIRTSKIGVSSVRPPSLVETSHIFSSINSNFKKESSASLSSLNFFFANNILQDRWGRAISFDFDDWLAQ